MPNRDAHDKWAKNLMQQECVRLECATHLVNINNLITLIADTKSIISCSLKRWATIEIFQN